MDYIGLCIRDLDEISSAVLTVRLSEEGFESFEEKENELWAYIPRLLYHPDRINKILMESGVEAVITNFPEQNWNREWESNFQPVTISGRCRVRAPFHRPEQGWQYEIIIEPKMSFGTAHHETTSMMLEVMLDMDFKGKKVLDLGCGTGILAILADKMNAGKIIAVDNDEWAYNNALENMRENNADRTDVIFGGVKDIPVNDFDIILANINRNAIFEQFSDYNRLLKTEGVLLVSGFYDSDLTIIKEHATLSGFSFISSLTKNHWVAVKFGK